MPIGSSRILCPYHEIKFACFCGLADSVAHGGDMFVYSCECVVGGIWRQCKLYVSSCMKKADAEVQSCCVSV